VILQLNISLTTTSSVLVEYNRVISPELVSPVAFKPPQLLKAKVVKRNFGLWDFHARIFFDA
jgi:hypothetical protein